MRRLNTGIIGPMVLVRGDWWHWCDNWQKPLVRKVMHCDLNWCTELVHSALCPGVRSLCALIAWQGAQIQCSTLVNSSGAVPWCRGLVPPTKCQGLSPILATHPPPSSTPHQPYLPTTKSWTDVALLTTDLINLRVISTPSLSRNNGIHIFFPNNLLCSCSSWDFFSLLGANYWHFCITKWFLAPKCPLEWFDKI